MGFLKKFVTADGTSIEYWTIGTCHIDYIANYIEIEILGYANKDIADAEGWQANYLMSGTVGNHLNGIPTSMNLEYFYDIVKTYDSIKFSYIGSARFQYTLNFKDAEMI